MRRTGPVLLASLALGASVGCTTLEEPTGELALTVDGTAYQAMLNGVAGADGLYGFTVVARFENRGTAPVYLPRCLPDSPAPLYGVVLADEDDPRGSAYNALWFCAGPAGQFRVAPGEGRTDTLEVLGPYVTDPTTGQAIGVLEGVMRIAYRVRGCDGNPGCASDLVRSTAFAVTPVTPYYPTPGP